MQVDYENHVSCYFEIGEKSKGLYQVSHFR